MKTTIEDRQVHEDDDRRYRNVIIRAQPTYQGVPAYDNVKAIIEEDGGRKLYFAKYVLPFIMTFIVIPFFFFIVLHERHDEPFVYLQVVRLFQGCPWPTLRRASMVRGSTY